MITITKSMSIPDDPSLVVAASAGEYADTDLILCALKSDPDAPIAQFQAQYLKYGPVVYQHNTPEELGAALVAIDPESTHDAATLYKEEEARRIARQGGTLKPEDPVAAPDAIQEDAKVVSEEKKENEVKDEIPEGEVLGEQDEPESIPEVPSGEGISTTTPDGTPEELPSSPPLLEESFVPLTDSGEIPSIGEASTTETIVP